MFKTIYYIIFALAVVLISGSNLAAAKDEKGNAESKSLENSDYLLPRNIEPNNYIISMTVDLEKFEFVGTVTIDLKVLNDTDRIILHSKNLVFNKVEVRNQQQDPQS